MNLKLRPPVSLLGLLCVFAAILGVSTLGAESSLTWESKAVELQQFLVQKVNQSPERTAAYWQKFSELGKLVNAETVDRLRGIESPGIHEVLALIAGDCANKPEALEELRAWYIPSAYQVTAETRQKTYERMKQLGYPEYQMVPLKFVKWIRPKGAPDGDEYDLFVIHCRPEYRSAWEAFYLQPTLGKMRQAQQALEEYADERLPVVMEQSFLGLTAIRLPGEANRSKDAASMMILTNVGRTEKVSAVRALLACLDAAAEDPFAPTGIYSAQRKISGLLRPKYPPYVTSNFAKRRKEPVNFVPLMEEVLRDPSLPQRHRDFLVKTLQNMPAR